MPNYHINIVVGGQDYYEYDQTLESIEELAELYNKGQRLVFSGISIDPQRIGKIRIYKTQLSNRDLIDARAWDVGINVTRRFIKSPPSDDFAPRPNTKNIFIVHGRDHKPVKELKRMLNEFGLRPIVLHEQPSGSRTVIEQLERHSGVGYTFVILTPDDIGALYSRFAKIRPEIVFKHSLKSILDLRPRARQNVILEFGYFMGLLGRDKVCCLYKGDIELPSDMHGIIYIPFKESINERREKIIQELNAVGYEMKTKEMRDYWEAVGNIRKEIGAPPYHSLESEWEQSQRGRLSEENIRREIERIRKRRQNRQKENI